MNKMGKLIIATAKVGSSVSGFLAVSSAVVATARNGKKYLDINMSDGTDSVMVKKWDFEGDAPAIGILLHIEATVGEYPPGSGQKQMVAQRMRHRCESDDISIADFARRSPLSDEELWETAMQLIGIITDEEYRRIIMSIYSKFEKQILVAPAAVYHHQAYIGGLLEHMIAVTKSAIAMADETTNLSLLIAGSMLHDIGKINTYKMQGLVPVMTDAGLLLDHIVMGIMIVENVTFNVSCNEQKVLLLQHIIAAHHGKLEWGSPVEGKLIEALLIHQADVSHVTATKVKDIIHKTSPDQQWSAFDRRVGIQLLIPQLDGYVVEPIENY
jgi:3'-5' exoribonuclease